MWFQLTMNRLLLRHLESKPKFHASDASDPGASGDFKSDSRNDDQPGTKSSARLLEIWIHIEE